MGRTLQPYSHLVDSIYERFSKFRKALRKEDRRSFDALMMAARSQLQVGVMSAQPNPFDSMAMSMMIELHKEVLSLQSRLESLERKMKSEQSTCRVNSRGSIEENGSQQSSWIKSERRQLDDAAGQ